VSILHDAVEHALHLAAHRVLVLVCRRRRRRRRRRDPRSIVSFGGFVEDYQPVRRAPLTLIPTRHVHGQPVSVQLNKDYLPVWNAVPK
jgi:hypothetical protein